MGKGRICDPDGEGMFLEPWGDGTKPNLPVGLLCGIVMAYSFLGVAIISDIFMASIEMVTSWKKKVLNPETGRRETFPIWNETVATLTLMALGSSAPEIFLAVIENFKRGFHSGDLGPSTIVGSAAFNLFVIIAVCISVIPADEIRRIDNLNAFLVTAVFSIGAYMWMVFALVLHGKDVIDIGEAILTLFYLPLLVWVAYSIDVGVLRRYLDKYSGSTADEDEGVMEAQDPCRLHSIGFESSDLSIAGLHEPQELDVTILRKGGNQAATQFSYRTERMSGVPGYDFEDHAGTIEFDKGEMQVHLKLSISAKSSFSVSRTFLLILESAEGACDFDEEGDGGEESAMLTIEVTPIAEPSSMSGCRAADCVFNFNSLRFAFGEWGEQFVSACFCNGSREEQAEASVSDWVFHIVSIPWKLAFCLVPPSSFFGGWLTFVIAIVFIGLCTAFVSDVAEMFGCLFDIPDVVTATIFVALGTSMPDLFASLTAAVGDPNADASIVNVTGSNAINVFLGLGIPWLCAAVYWNFIAERSADWEQRYPEIAAKYSGGTVFVVESRNLGFCVMIFSGLCTVAIILLVLRRKFLGCELGGPKVPKLASSFLLIFLWVAFVCLTSWRVLRCEGASPGHWCKASALEQMIVCGSVMFMTCMVAFPTLGIIMRSDTQVCKPIGSERSWSEAAAGLAELPPPNEARRVSSTMSGGSNVEDEVKKLKDKEDKSLRKAATKDKDKVRAALAFDNFSLGDEPEDEAFQLSDINFLKVRPAAPHTSSIGCHKVSTLKSHHAWNNDVVSVIVVAYHSSGRNETVFQTKLSRPMRNVFHAWCKQHNLDEKRASFTFGRKSIEGSATLASLRHDPAKGPMIIHARPQRRKGSNQRYPEAAIAAGEAIAAEVVGNDAVDAV